MWRLLPITLLRFASAFPTNWNGTTTCPQDALYTSLIGDGGEFCSSVLEGSHCGTGYSTPPEYMRYNQTQISSYCECILTDSGAITTSANSSRETTGDVTVTTADSASQTGSQSVSETQSEMGRPGGLSDSTSMATTEGPTLTPTGSSNGTDLTSSSLGDATGSGASASTSIESQSYPLGFNLDDNYGNTNSWFLESDSICCVLRRSFRRGRLKFVLDDDDWHTNFRFLEPDSVSCVLRRSFKSDHLKPDLDDDDWYTWANDI
ncbi:hypothetical protein BHE90_003592 [Fusarium euwallaceae]|uniref:Uncharacterized protein n=1 Tax=Fusarium euwallaceae TaxID=1147111 RepID=A0A430M1X3_9HYPO|nr:hypothetical protein BHE90_003592 [Fusarium euwallaceae]